MSGRGKVVFVARSEIPNSGRDAIQLITDMAVKECAVFIEVQDPAPAVGEEIAWTTPHVFWSGKRLRKLGYAFDPDQPLR